MRCWTWQSSMAGRATRGHTARRNSEPTTCKYCKTILENS